MPTLTVNPTTYGSLGNGSKGSWADARVSPSDAGDGTLTAADEKQGGGTYRVVRAFMTFNTSALLSGFVIKSAKLRLYMTSHVTTGMATYGFYIVSNTQASNTGLATSDFGSCGTTDLNSGLQNPQTNNQYYEYSIGTANITKLGYTKFALRGNRDTINSAPEDNGDIESYTFDPSTNKPELVIEYTVPSGGFFSLI